MLEKIKTWSAKRLLLLAGAAVLLVLAAVALLWNSGSGDAYTAYQKGLARLEAAKSAEISVRVGLSLAEAEEQNSVRVMSTLRREGQGAKRRMAAELNLNYFGEAQEQNLYYTEGYLYRDYMGQKLKQAADYGEALEQLQMAALDIPRAAVGKTTVTKGADGVQHLLMSLDDELLRELLMERLLALDDGSGLDDFPLTLRGAELYVDLQKNGDLRKRLLLFTASVQTGEEQTASLVYEMELNVLKSGGVSVALPEDLGEYVDISQGETP